MASTRPLHGRRRFLLTLPVVVTAGGAIAGGASMQDGITTDTIKAAAAAAGLEFTDDELDLMLEDVNEQLDSFRAMRDVTIPNEVYPAIHFDPVLPGMTTAENWSAGMTRRPAPLPIAGDSNWSFASIARLGQLLRSGSISSEQLTQHYLGRLKDHGDELECVITLTEDLALRQARRADDELRRGVYRSPLHGIPYGAKDLLAEDSYPTTWGAEPYRDQVLEYDATVVRKLEDAGAVLVAKLTLGALAWGDVWFGGMTRNPWNLEQGSSGSSAGSASATVAGLVGFSIGSETWGSIVSPATRCGATGLRPTFGRVSRHGAMALSWSMDKLGPICRSAEDCALVFEQIHGADGRDPTARTLPFQWDPDVDLADLRIGFYKEGFDEEREDKSFDDAVLAVLESHGARLIPITVPDAYPVDALSTILTAEAAAAFDDLSRSGRDDLLVRQERMAWPNFFRVGRLIPAVEYIQANRIRTMLMGSLEAALSGIDMFVTPSFAGDVLLMTNLTGHPSITVPNGYREDGTPTSITFVGRLFGEGQLVSVARRYQEVTGFHEMRPLPFTD